VKTGEFCPSCGRPRDSTLRFCRGCGLDFDAPVTSVSPVDTPVPTAPDGVLPVSAGHDMKRIARVIGAVVVILVAVAAINSVIHAKSAVDMINGIAGKLAAPPAVAVGNAGWTRSANYTTCQQWATEMTQAQREAMAALLLPVLRATVDSAADDGSALVPAFVAAISATCQSSGVTQYEAQSGQPYVVTAAAALAFTENTRFHP